MEDRQMLRSSDFMHERAFSILLQISGSLLRYTSMQLYILSKVDKGIDNLNVSICTITISILPLRWLPLDSSSSFIVACTVAFLKCASSQARPNSSHPPWHNHITPGLPLMFRWFHRSPQSYNIWLNRHHPYVHHVLIISVCLSWQPNWLVDSLTYIALVKRIYSTSTLVSLYRNVKPLSHVHIILHFPSMLWQCWLGDRKVHRPVKKLDVGLLVVMIWLLLCTTYISSSPVVTTTSIILCFNTHRLTQVHLENGR